MIQKIVEQMDYRTKAKSASGERPSNNTSVVFLLEKHRVPKLLTRDENIIDNPEFDIKGDKNHESRINKQR